ncbi:MAG: riboflavin biosynthesis protein RibF [Bacteroidetes bacterium]|nr:riboflavin biosynthesis protein RibF [Bacteroidota bacterium]
MRVFHDLGDLIQIPNPVVTTGSFDGVHVGHKAIINRINRLARDIQGESVLITFHPHPRKVLYPETAGKDLFLINSQQEKIELLRSTGLKNLLILPFTVEFSHTTSIEFIRNILVNKLRAAKIVIGFNHQFGFNREGNFEYLDELGKFYGFGVEEIPEQDIHNETVSSTLIRKALQDGRIQRANAYLDHHYFMMGCLKEGSPDLKQMDLSTFMLTIEEECKLVPPDGVYAVRIETAETSTKGILNIKNSRYGSDRNKEDILIEMFPFNNQDMRNEQEAKVYFAKRVRDELSFGDISELKMQLDKDQATVDEMIY